MQLEQNQSNLTSALNGKRSLGTGVLSKIALAYDINIEWLTTGEGCIYTNKNTLQNEATSTYENNDYTARYIKHLEEEVQELRKTITEQTNVIQNLLNKQN